MLSNAAYNRALGAALFLLAKEYNPDWRGWPKTESEILLLAGASPRDAREAAFELRELLLELECRLGLPLPDFDPASTRLQAVLGALRDWGLKNITSVPRNVGGTRLYPEGFQRFVASLAAPGQPGHGMTLDELAYAVDVPVNLLKDWLSVGQPQPRRRKKPKS